MSEAGAVEFRLTRARADFFPATMAMMLRLRGKLIYLLALIVVLITAVTCMIYRGSDAMLSAGAGTFIGMSLYSAAVWYGVSWFNARRGASAPGALEETHYLFNDEGVFGEAANIQSKTKWDYWKQAFSTPRFLIIASHTGQWMFFPKRALAPEALKGLEDLARAKLQFRGPATRSAA